MLSRACAIAVLALVAVTMGFGCGRRQQPERVETILTPPGKAQAKPKASAKPPLTAKPPKQSAVAPAAAKPVAIPKGPVADTSRPAVAQDAWQQMRAARKTVRSYKSTVREGPLTTIQHIKMAAGRPVVVKVKEHSGAWVLADLVRGISYIYNPQDRTIMKLDNSSSAGSPEADEIDSIRKQKSEVRSGDLNGVDCWIVKITGTNAATYWVDKKLGIVRQIADDAGTRPITLEQTNSVPDSEFRLPAGVPVKDAAQMMKGMGGNPRPPK